MQENQQPPQQQPLDVNLDLIGLDAPSGVKEDQESKKESQLFGETRRREQFRQVVHIIRLSILCVGLTAVMSVFVIRALHLLLPDNVAANAGSWIPHCWLSEAQLASMDKFIFGAIGAFMAEYGVKALVSERDKKS